MQHQAPERNLYAKAGEKTPVVAWDCIHDYDEAEPADHEVKAKERLDEIIAAARADAGKLAPADGLVSGVDPRRSG